MPPAVATKHSTLLDIEPWTGATLNVHQRVQVRADDDDVVVVGWQQLIWIIFFIYLFSGFIYFIYSMQNTRIHVCE